MPHPASAQLHNDHHPIGHCFIELQSVDSTNNYAMAQVHAGLAFHGIVFFAHDQYSGKGQRGKTWISKPGENIMISVVLMPDFLSPGNQFDLSVCIALACRDFLQNQGMQELKIKWPNDLYWRDRKAGGILIENRLQGQDWQYAIVGIGININQIDFPEGVFRATSLRQCIDGNFEPKSLARTLCVFLESRFCDLKNGKQQEMLSEYNQVLYRVGQKLPLVVDGITVSAEIRSVNSGGELVIFDGQERIVNPAQVQWFVHDPLLNEQ